MYMSLVKSEQYDELWKDFKYLGVSYSIKNEFNIALCKIYRKYKNDIKIFIRANTIFDLPVYREKIHYNFFINYIKNYKYNSKTTDKQLIGDYSKHCQQFLRFEFAPYLFNTTMIHYVDKDMLKELLREHKSPLNEHQIKLMQELGKWENNGIID